MSIIDQLKEPFDPNVLHWRVGATTQDKSKGIALAYLNARDVMKRLDSVVGAEQWQTIDRKDGDTYYCQLSIKIKDEWITKTGAAGATQVEGEKGGSSDAFKRAAVLWGVGRYLYYLDNVWHPIKPQGRSYVLDGQPNLPSWALPKPKEQ